jgi:hypothetical protein
MGWARSTPWESAGVRPGPVVGSGLTVSDDKLLIGTGTGVEEATLGAGLQYSGGELSVVGETLDGIVQTYADLPVAIPPALGAIYLVRESSGTWLLNRKQRGIYQRVDDTGVLATDWQYLGEWLEEFSDANWSIYNSVDSTKALKFALAGLSTGVTATITVNGSCTLNNWFNQDVRSSASPTFAGGTFSGASFPVTVTERTSSVTNALRSSAAFKHTTTGDMVDGFASGIGFQIRDDSGVDNLIAQVSARRAGADNVGSLAILVGAGGAVESALFNASGGNGAWGQTTPAAGSFTTLAASGTASIGPGGTGSSNGTIVVNGGSGAAGGSYLGLRKNSVESAALGHESVLIGSGTSDALMLWAASGNTIKHYILGSGTVGTWSATGLSVTGTLGASGNVWSGNNGFSLSSGSTDGAYLGSSGQIIASQNNDNPLGLRRRSSDGAAVNFFRDTTNVGSISVTTTSTAYNTSSDARLKTDLGAFSRAQVAAPIYALSSLMRKYAWDVWLASEDADTRARFAYGWFAQEAKDVAPWMVHYDAAGDRYSINPMSLVPNIVACLGEHKSELDVAKERIAQLESRVAELEAA